MVKIQHYLAGEEWVSVEGWLVNALSNQGEAQIGIRCKGRGF